MTRPTDDELEAMAKRLERTPMPPKVSPQDTAIVDNVIDAAAMLRACKGGAQARYGNVKASTIQRDINRVRAAVRSHDPEATEQAWDKMERWLGVFPMHPAPDARQEGWRAGMMDAAQVADKRAVICQDAFEKTQDPTEGCAAHEARHIARTIRALAEKGPDHD
jgi:hypothetical protein